MVTLMAPVVLVGGILFGLSYFIPTPSLLALSLFFSFPTQGTGKMTVTTDKLVRCLVGDVL